MLPQNKTDRMPVGDNSTPTNFERHSNENAAKGRYANDLDYRIFSDAFFNNTSGFANTPIQIIDPDNNKNGIALIELTVVEYSTAAVPFWTVVANRTVPAFINDGTVVLAPSNLSVAVGQFAASGMLSDTRILPANLGLWVWPSINDSGSRNVLYRKL